MIPTPFPPLLIVGQPSHIAEAMAAQFTARQPAGTTGAPHSPAHASRAAGAGALATDKDPR